MANPLTAYKAWVVDNGAVVKKFEDTARMLTMFLPVNFYKQPRMSTPRSRGHATHVSLSASLSLVVLAESITDLEHSRVTFPSHM